MFTNLNYSIFLQWRQGLKMLDLVLCLLCLYQPPISWVCSITQQSPSQGGGGEGEKRGLGGRGGFIWQVVFGETWKKMGDFLRRPNLAFWRCFLPTELSSSFLVIFVSFHFSFLYLFAYFCLFGTNNCYSASKVHHSWWRIKPVSIFPFLSFLWQTIVIQIVAWQISAPFLFLLCNFFVLCFLW